MIKRILLTLIAAFGFLAPTLAFAAPTVEIWWPTHNAEIQGVQPFKGLVQGMDVNQYTMYWQVDGGNLVTMDTNYNDYPHKEATVDLTNWKWKGTGPYVLNFVAKNSSGAVIAQTTRTIYTGPKPTTTTTTTVTPTTTTVPTITAVVTPPTTSPSSGSAITSIVTGTVTSSNTTISGTVISPTTVVAPAPTPALVTPTVVTTPIVTAPTVSPSGSLAGKKLYVDPNSQAAAAVKATSGTNAALLSKISTSATAVWLGNWYGDQGTKDKIASVIAGAKAQNAVPSFVLYNIPQRDCGSYSAGGINNPDGYRAWVNLIANAIGTNQAIVVLEPDALPQADCLNSTDRATRMSLLSGAVTTLKSKGNIMVYMDAGHANWKSVDEISTLLNNAGVSKADGFSLNVSNYLTNSQNLTYGKAISAKVGNKHFVIDTSRNGNGGNGEWCNPSGRALGSKPTTTTNDPLVDAYLWIKAPGESDGQCNGGPSAGTWWNDYALGLARLALW